MKLTLAPSVFILQLVLAVLATMANGQDSPLILERFRIVDPPPPQRDLKTGMGGHSSKSSESKGGKGGGMAKSSKSKAGKGKGGGMAKSSKRGKGGGMQTTSSKSKEGKGKGGGMPSSKSKGGKGKGRMRRRKHMMGKGKGKEPPASECSPDCPCCSSDWPEFVAAIETFSSDDGCYVREDDTSDVTVLTSCDPARNVAYMSYDYSGTYPSEFYCGTSASAREFLTEKEGKSCESLITSKVKSEGVTCTSDIHEC